MFLVNLFQIEGHYNYFNSAGTPKLKIAEESFTDFVDLIVYLSSINSR